MDAALRIARWRAVVRRARGDAVGVGAIPIAIDAGDVRARLREGAA